MQTIAIPCGGGDLCKLKKMVGLPYPWFAGNLSIGYFDMLGAKITWCEIMKPTKMAILVLYYIKRRVYYYYVRRLAGEKRFSTVSFSSPAEGGFHSRANHTLSPQTFLTFSAKPVTFGITKFVHLCTLSFNIALCKDIALFHGPITQD